MRTITPHGRYNLNTKPGAATGMPPMGGMLPSQGNQGKVIHVMYSGLRTLDVNPTGGRELRTGMLLQPIQADAQPFSDSAQMSAL